MTNHTCLNCNRQTSGNFCSNCGQKTSTHRYSVKDFFAHDFVLGIFHFDSGFFYTIKELFTRPGHSVREFIKGKRVKHFNYFTLVILLLTLIYFLSKWAKVDFTEFLNKESVSGLSKVYKDYAKIANFLIVPIFALYSYFIFRKTKQNYTENLILNIFLLAGMVVIRIPIYFSLLFPISVDFFTLVNITCTILTLIYIFVFFYQYFKAFSFSKATLVRKVIIISIAIIATKQGVNMLVNQFGIHFLK